jgi:hypothetical protein
MTRISDHGSTPRVSQKEHEPEHKPTPKPPEPEHHKAKGFDGTSHFDEQHHSRMDLSGQGANTARPNEVRAYNSSPPPPAPTPTPTPTGTGTPPPTGTPTQTPPPSAQPAPQPGPTPTPPDPAITAARNKVSTAQAAYDKAAGAVHEYNEKLGRQLERLPAMSDGQRAEYVKAFREKYDAEHGDVFKALDTAAKTLNTELQAARKLIDSGKFDATTASMVYNGYKKLATDPHNSQLALDFATQVNNARQGKGDPKLAQAFSANQFPKLADDIAAPAGVNAVTKLIAEGKAADTKNVFRQLRDLVDGTNAGVTTKKILDVLQQNPGKLTAAQFQSINKLAGDVTDPANSKMLRAVAVASTMLYAATAAEAFAKGEGLEGVKDTASALAAFTSTSFGKQVAAEAMGSLAASVGSTGVKFAEKAAPVLSVIAGSISLYQNASQFNWSLSSGMSVAGDVASVFAGVAAAVGSGGVAAALGAGGILLTLGAEAVKNLERNYNDSQEMQHLLSKKFGPEVGGMLFHARQDNMNVLEQNLGLSKDQIWGLAKENPGLMGILITSPGATGIGHRLDRIQELYGLSPAKMLDVMKALDTGLSRDADYSSAVNDLAGPIFDGVRTRQDFVKQARYRISLEPNSESATFYRNLLTALGEKP